MGIFNKVYGNKPRRNAFNLSFSVKTTMEMGKLYPICIQEMVPGDTFKLGNEVVINLQPMNAPAYINLNWYCYSFFVPYRVLWDKWEEFITKGQDGDTTIALPKFERNQYITDSAFRYDTLWDYFGFPVGVVPSGLSAPVDFPWRAYNLIWNEYFRDENLQDPVGADPVDKTVAFNTDVLNVNWGKDYFTGALPFAQRGTASALPITSDLSKSNDLMLNSLLEVGINEGGQVGFSQLNSKLYDVPGVSGGTFKLGGLNNDIPSGESSIVAGGNHSTGALSTPIDLSGTIVSTTADVEDLRMMFAIQRWQEINARGGVRYTEFLRAQYGTSPRDERLQRPEFIGGCKSPIIVQNVLQQSNADNASVSQKTLVGTKYGQGMTADVNNLGTYYASEFGIMMIVAFLRPKTSYMQGINRQWLKNNTFDFFNPLFTSLGEQEVLNEEIFAKSGDSDPLTDKNSNRSIWGYEARYNEMRYNADLVTGKMRPNKQTGVASFDYWHLGRYFDTLPNLNGAFLKCNPDKRIFQATDEVGFICHIGNRIKALRPLPYMAVPHLKA